MAIAEGPTKTLAVGYHGGRALGHVIEVGLMRGNGVVAVDAVFGQQLPVGLDGVPVGPRNHIHTVDGLVGHQVEIFGGPGQILPQRHRFLVEANEDETPVAVVARRPQAQLGAVEIRAVAFDIGHPDQFPGWTLRIFRCYERGRLRVGDRGTRELLNVWGNYG